MKKKYPGFFVSIEGGDGVGKTTAIKALEKKLIQNNIKYFLTREPGGSKISESIRNIILDKNNTEEDSRTEALLYAASRRQHLVEIIIPKLNNGELVITDRYIDSSLAYQGYARGIGIKKVFSINSFAIDNYIPNLTFFLELSPEEGLKRISKNKRIEDRLDQEKISFHEKVYAGYHILIKKYKRRFVVIDASKSPDQVAEQMFIKLMEYKLKWMKTT